MMVLGMNLGVGERSSRSQSRGWRRRNPDTQTGAASSNATVSICTDPEFGEKQIRIVSWNCRKLDQVGWDLWEIDRTLADVDVVVLQEVGKYTACCGQRAARRPVLSNPKPRRPIPIPIPIPIPNMVTCHHP